MSPAASPRWPLPRGAYGGLGWATPAFQGREAGERHHCAFSVPCGSLGCVGTGDGTWGLYSGGEVPASPRVAELLYGSEFPVASKDQYGVVTEALVAPQCSSGVLVLQYGAVEFFLKCSCSLSSFSKGLLQSDPALLKRDER